MAASPKQIGQQLRAGLREWRCHLSGRRIEQHDFGHGDLGWIGYTPDGKRAGMSRDPNKAAGWVLTGSWDLP